jgi:hypothetical protein
LGKLHLRNFWTISLDRLDFVLLDGGIKDEDDLQRLRERTEYWIFM